VEHRSISPVKIIKKKIISNSLEPKTVLALHDSSQIAGDTAVAAAEAAVTTAVESADIGESVPAKPDAVKRCKYRYFSIIFEIVLFFLM
jgi:hypothetical protein